MDPNKILRNQYRQLEHGSGWIEAEKIFSHGLVVGFAPLHLLGDDVSILESSLDFRGAKYSARAAQVVSDVDDVGGLSDRVRAGHAQMNTFFNRYRSR